MSSLYITICIKECKLVAHDDYLCPKVHVKILDVTQHANKKMRYDDNRSYFNIVYNLFWQYNLMGGDISAF